MGSFLNTIAENSVEPKSSMPKVDRLMLIDYEMLYSMPKLIST